MRRIVTFTLLVAMAVAHARAPACAMIMRAGTDGGHAHGAAAPGPRASAATGIADAADDAAIAGVAEGPAVPRPHPEDGCDAAMSCTTVMLAAPVRVAAAPLALSPAPAVQASGPQPSAEPDPHNPPPRPLA
jgi:hypothetical protein